MKTRLAFKNLLLAFSAGAIITVTSTSCSKDDPTPTPTLKNVVEYAQSDANFSILVAAVAKAGLVDVLSNTQNLTVFAPTNQAFQDAGYTLAVINSLDTAAVRTVLTPILAYHVLTSKVASSAITGTNTAVPTFGNGPVLYATRNTAGVFINGIPVKTADVAVSNGVIHVIEKVLLPPAGTILATAVALGADTSPNGFSLLVAAVLRGDESGAGNPISSALASAGPFTVFAPTNQAFIDAGFPTVASINAAPAATIANILLYHVVAARVFSSDLTAGQVPTALGADKKVTIALPSSGATVLGSSNGTDASNIIATDVVATNGVIHVIDRVLLP